MKIFLANLWRAVPVAVILVAPFAPRAAAQDFDQRARKVVQQMTLDEKIGQLHGIRDEQHYRYVPGIPRLGIPPFQITNGPAGAGPGGVTKTVPQVKATALSSPISLAATWDMKLAREYGEIVGAESHDIGNALVEAPTINIVRVPRNGRTFEGYGEDPYLAGEISVANIEGIQSEGVIANVKHYVANNQETDRFRIDEEIGERALREIYLPAFEMSILKGHSASVMCAYPRINGTFNCENELLLNGILKKEWGFNGFITSDFGAVHSTVPSALAGLDLEMPTGKYFGDDLKKAVESGQVPISVIDDKLIRRFRTMMQFGLFDHPPVPKPIPAKEDGARSREIAEAGIVLLKNVHGILPLSASTIHAIALIGPMATRVATGGGSSHVVPLYNVDPLDGLKNATGAQVKVTLADGSNIADAVAEAKAADVAIVMVGEIDTEGHDHPLELANNQDQLVDAIAAANPRTVVVLKTGSAVFMPWLSKVPALLEVWYPGEEDGNAVADVLFGKVNPSGKLPLTFPKRLEDLPANTPERYPGVDGVAHYTEGVFVGYRHFDEAKIEPLFPFGFGLSYTSFKYSGLKITADSKAHYLVEFDVTNSGKVAGAEVAQLYLGLPSTEAPEPPLQLKGFSKVFLAPGRKAHIKLPLDSRAFSYWNENEHRWSLTSGSCTVMVGSSSRDMRLRGGIVLRNTSGGNPQLQ